MVKNLARKFQQVNSFRLGVNCQEGWRSDQWTTNPKLRKGPRQHCLWNVYWITSSPLSDWQWNMKMWINVTKFVYNDLSQASPCFTKGPPTIISKFWRTRALLRHILWSTPSLFYHVLPCFAPEAWQLPPPAGCVDWGQPARDAH